ncbi:MAG: CDP-alcohol phosphatidyltransferase family protein [Clostridia bacterium]|nr:CDP-alcohol phosphatidyltransferase family protein [Clostridiaceae bacterium]
MFKHVPNILTMLRFVLIPFIFIAIIHSDYVLAFILLTLSGITDILDGFIARKFNFITNFGKLIDPLSDKATQVSVLAALCIENIIPLWILFIVFLKEIIMIAGASFLYGKELVVSSKWYGKLSTVLFYAAIVASLIVKYFNISFHFDTYIYYLALIMTIFSLIMYFNAFYKQGYLKKENLKIVDKNK